jgi:hypothetical protein
MKIIINAILTDYGMIAISSTKIYVIVPNIAIQKNLTKNDATNFINKFTLCSFKANEITLAKL